MKELAPHLPIFNDITHSDFIFFDDKKESFLN